MTSAPERHQVELAAEMLKALADPSRLRVLLRLARGELSVGEIAKLEQEKITTISARLKILLTARLIRRRRDGQTIFYSIADAHVLNRPGAPVHEVFRPRHEPNVIAIGALTVQPILAWDQQLAATPHPVAGPASAFLGQIHSGEIYNQCPQTCRIQGTMRWLPGQRWEDVHDEYRRLTNAIAKETGATMETGFCLIRDAFQLDLDSGLATDFMAAYTAVSGTTLPVGAKPLIERRQTTFSNAPLQLESALVAAAFRPACTGHRSACSSHRFPSNSLSIDELRDHRSNGALKPTRLSCNSIPDLVNYGSVR
jgi:DNA-binding transcriptional ArsR family regulator